MTGQPAPPGGQSPHPARATSSPDKPTAAYWQIAIPVEQYAGALWRKHRKVYVANRDRAIIPDELLAAIARPLSILILTEPWCEDSAQFIPVVWRLSLESPCIDARVLRPSEHREIENRYPGPGGNPAIPVFIIFDERMSERGAIVERPPIATAEITAEIRHFQQEHATLPGINRSLSHMPDDTRATLTQHLAAWRMDESRYQRWARALIEDLLSTV